MNYTIYHINFLTEGLETKLLDFSELYHKENKNNYLVTRDDLYSSDRVILLIKNDEDFLGYSYSKLINNKLFIKVIFIKDKYKDLDIKSNIIEYLKENISQDIEDETLN